MPLGIVLLLVALTVNHDVSAAVPANPPLSVLTDVPLPGEMSRFDYMDVDPVRGHLVIAHMGDDEVLVVSLADGSTIQRLRGIQRVRGIRVASAANLILATAAGTDELVRIDATRLFELSRTPTGRGPDGVDWDPKHRVVAVSDQRDGALSLISNDGAGRRFQVLLGAETGNVVFDPRRRVFWTTVVRSAGADQLVAVDPLTGDRRATIDLPGCAGAHGLRLHPDGQSAFVACERNGVLARVELAGRHGVMTATVGADPDVLSVDPGLERLYVASERGDVTVFDIGHHRLVPVEREHVGDGAHTVAVDPSTHRVFVPLPSGGGDRPVLRIMSPAGS